MKNLTCVWRNIYNTARRGGSRIFRTSVKKKSDRAWSAQGVVSAGRGQRRTWWTPRGLNNFNADSPYIKFDSTFEEMIV